MRTGNDYFASSGASVVAARGGVVEDTGWGVWGPAYGYQIVVRTEGDAGNTVKCLYAHLSDIDVIRGQHVETGQHIGNVGNSGTATGPHLHYEERTTPFLYNNKDRLPQFDIDGNQHEEDDVNDADIKKIADAVRAEIFQTELFQGESDPDLKNITVRDGLKKVVREAVKGG